MQAQNYELNFIGHNIYVGMDVHLKSWTVTIRTEHLEYKRFTQPPDAKALYNYLTRNFSGATYYSVYEAGFCGFSVHRQLEAFGICNIVVNAADVPTKQKEKVEKTYLPVFINFAIKCKVTSIQINSLKNAYIYVNINIL
jgi:hypothetical protein